MVSASRAAISLGIPGGQRRLPHLPVLQREAHSLAGHQVQACGGGGPVDPEVGRPGQQEPACAAPRGQAAGYRLQNRVNEAVFGTRGIGDIDVDLAVRALQAAQQDPGRPGAQIVAAVVAAHRQGVGQHRDAGLRPERGVQHHRLVRVRPAGLEVAGRPDREMPATGIQDAAEHGGRVEPRETQPVHRPGPADQGRRAAVRQQGVVADRQAIHRGVPFVTGFKGRRPRADAARLR